MSTPSRCLSLGLAAMVVGAVLLFGTVAESGVAASNPFRESAVSADAPVVTNGLHRHSASSAASKALLDPFCRAFFLGNLPAVVTLLPSFKPIVGGAVRFPGCEGSIKNKALTIRTGKVCVQILEGSGRRRAFHSLNCQQTTFLTRSFGTYTLGAIAPCRRGTHRYRLTDALTLQLGPLIRTATGDTNPKYLSC